MPQAFYLVPVPSGGQPDQGLPGGPPNYPSTGPVFPGRPVDPGYGQGQGGRPDQGLPPFPGYPSTGPIYPGGHPDQGLPYPPHYPSQGPIYGGGYPSHGLPHPPHYPSQGPIYGGGYPSHGLPGGGYPSTGPVFPPIYPVDPDWGVGEGGGVKHPLLWLLPWLIKPATNEAAVSEPPTGEKPDPDKSYQKILVAVGPGKFQWAWSEAGAPEPKTT